MKHYDEKAARSLVASWGGAKWTYSQVVEMVLKFVDHMDLDDSVWDAFVAVHYYWHKMRAHYAGEEELQDAALRCAFIERRQEWEH